VLFLACIVPMNYLFPFIMQNGRQRLLWGILTKHFQFYLMNIIEVTMAVTATTVHSVRFYQAQAVNTVLLLWCEWNL